MFKNIMLGTMTTLLIGWVVIYSFPAQADRKKGEFEYVGQAGACRVYKLETAGAPVYAASSMYADYSCSVAR